MSQIKYSIGISCVIYMVDLKTSRELVVCVLVVRSASTLNKTLFICHVKEKWMGYGYGV